VQVPYRINATMTRSPGRPAPGSSEVQVPYRINATMTLRFSQEIHGLQPVLPVLQLNGDQ